MSMMSRVFRNSAAALLSAATVFAAAATAATTSPFLSCTKPSTQDGLRAIEVTRLDNRTSSVTMTEAITDNGGDVRIVSPSFHNYHCGRPQVVLSKNNDAVYLTELACEEKEYDWTGSLLRMDFTRVFQEASPEADPAHVDGYAADRTWIRLTVFEGGQKWQPNDSYDVSRTPAEKATRDHVRVRGVNTLGTDFQCRLNLAR